VEVQEAEPKTPAAPEPARPAPPSNDARNDARAELADRIQAWIAATNAGDIDQQMAFYQPRLVAFYTSRNTSRSAVRREKVRLFGSASVIAMSASDPVVTVSADGRTATTRFRKRFVIERPGPDRRGEVLQELRWQRTGDGWKIVSERDLRVLRRGGGGGRNA
jgi:ketosteroid isomerase-like protein